MAHPLRIVDDVVRMAAAVQVDHAIVDVFGEDRDERGRLHDLKRVGRLQAPRRAVRQARVRGRPGHIELAIALGPVRGERDFLAGEQRDGDIRRERDPETVQIRARLGVPGAARCQERDPRRDERSSHLAADYTCAPGCPLRHDRLDDADGVPLGVLGRYGRVQAAHNVSWLTSGNPTCPATWTVAASSRRPRCGHVACTRGDRRVSRRACDELGAKRLGRRAGGDNDEDWRTGGDNDGKDSNAAS